jgi:molybdopterin-guanine dinucleotide biosynthesis protein A
MRTASVLPEPIVTRSSNRPDRFEPVVVGLLAGGTSRRMGRDKAALDLGGRALAQWPAAALAPIAEHRVQVGGDPIDGLGWRVVSDRRSNCGPAAGLETLLLEFPGASVVVCGVDLPFVPSALLARALERLPGYAAAIPRHGGRWHGLVGAYSPALLPELSRWLDDGRRDLQRLLDQADVYALESAELAAFGAPEHTLCNVNTREELDMARAGLGAG